MKEKLEIILMLLRSVKPSVYSFEKEQTLRSKAFIKINREYLKDKLGPDGYLIDMIELALEEKTVEVAAHCWSEVIDKLGDKYRLLVLRN